jgi:hypothetical protein
MQEAKLAEKAVSHPAAANPARTTRHSATPPIGERRGARGQVSNPVRSPQLVLWQYSEASQLG